MIKLRTLSTLIVLIAVVLATSAFMPQQKEKAKYTNLRVLPKKITEEELEKIMRHYNTALGVKCSHCHVRNTQTNKMDYASDLKEEKLSARSMMKMTMKLNIKNFGAKKGQYNPAVMEVSCQTCHRGKTHP